MRRWLSMAVVGGLALAALPAAAQDVERWTSPTHGFSVEWDPSVWSESPGDALIDQGPDDLDRLLLVGEIGPLYIEGATRYGGEPGACVDGELELLSSEPGFGEATRLPEYDAGGPNAAAGAFSAVLDQDEGPVTLIGYVFCERADDDSVAIATLIAPEADFPESQRQADPVIASIETGIPIGPEAVKQAFRDALEEARAQPPAAGPFTGELVSGAAGAGERPAGVDLADFAASVTFAPPQAPVGLAFRRGEDGSEVRLLVSPDGSWAMSDGTSEFASGKFAAPLSGPIAIDLLVSGTIAQFSVGGGFSGPIGLPAGVAAGDVVAIGGADTPAKFSRFSVWELPVEDPATPDGEPTPENLPVLPDGDGAEGTPEPAIGGGVQAVVIAEAGDSGVDGLATITSVEGEAYVNLALRGGSGGELAVIHEGSCADLGAAPAYLLQDPDEGGRSKTGLGVPTSVLAAEALAIAIHPSAADFGTVLACGDIALPEGGILDDIK